MQSAPRKLFVSYAHEDGDLFARELSAKLSAAGHQPWRDHERLTSQGGVRWSREITRQVLTADVVLIVLTPKANDSHYVEAEWMKALEYERPVVPLMFLTCGVPLPLMPLQYIDFRTDPEAGFAALLDRLAVLDNPVAWVGRDQQTLEALQTLRATAPGSRHTELDGLIAELTNRINNFQDNVRAQTDRVERGLAELKARAAEEAARPVGPGVRRYGRRPPTPLDGFRDRVEAQSEIARSLADPKVRMVSVLGRGGMGKTALACYILNQIEAGHWPSAVSGPMVQGVVYLQHTPTQPITLDRVLLYVAKVLPDEVAAKADRVFNNRDLSTEDRVERILDLLGSQLVIVLLDNFEDLLDERGRLRDADLSLFLRRALVGPPALRLLVTARAPVNLSVAELRAERQVHLRDGLPEDDAVALLKDLDPNQQLGLSTARDVELQRLVRLTHGIPRALELVASILKGEDDMAFLLAIDDVANDFYTRETVVQKLVEVNYATLRPEARRVIEALAVLGRPVPQVAIDFLLQPHVPGLRLGEVLQPLVNARLVSFERGREGKPGTLGLHPIDRDFLYRRLPREGNYSRTTLHLRAAEYYRTQRTHSATRWRDLVHLLPQILEYEHLVLAEDYEAAIALLGEYASAIAHCGHPTYCRDMFQKLPDRFKSESARFYYSLTEMVWKAYLGPISDALSIGERALQHAIAIGNPNLELLVRQQLVIGYRYSHDARRSLLHAEWIREHMLKSVSEESSTGNASLSPPFDLCLDLILAHTFLGDLQSAAAVGREALHIAQEHPDLAVRANAWNSLTVLRFAQGRFAQAIQTAHEAEQIWELGFHDGLAYVKNLAGMSHYLLGDYPAAIAKLTEARATANEWDSPRPEALVLWNLSLIHTLHGVYDKGMECGREAAVLMTRLGLDRTAPLPQTAAEAAAVGDISGCLRALLQAAEESIRCGDLFPGTFLAERASLLAQHHSLVELTTEADSLRARLTARLVLPDTED